jgi:hypothetical protein
MEIKDPKSHPVLKKIVQALIDALGDQLSSIVLYGSAARGDFYAKTSNFNLLIVCQDLTPAILAKLSGPLSRWRRQGQPSPSIFSRTILEQAADVFPIEFLDIKHRRVTLYGTDPFAEIEIHLDHLRLQCERELREKLMRLREGYIECHSRPRDLKRLLTSSFTTFVAIFRGCLHLHEADIPVHNDEVVAAFCSRAGLEQGPFDEVDRLKQGLEVESDPQSIFSRYYRELGEAVTTVDRFGGKAI